MEFSVTQEINKMNDKLNIDRCNSIVLPGCSSFGPGQNNNQRSAATLNQLDFWNQLTPNERRFSNFTNSIALFVLAEEKRKEDRRSDLRKAKILSVLTAILIILAIFMSNYMDNLIEEIAAVDDVKSKPTFYNEYLVESKLLEFDQVYATYNNASNTNSYIDKIRNIIAYNLQMNHDNHYFIHYKDLGFYNGQVRWRNKRLNKGVINGRFSRRTERQVRKKSKEMRSHHAKKVMIDGLNSITFAPESTKFVKDQIIPEPFGYGSMNYTKTKLKLDFYQGSFIEGRRMGPGILKCQNKNHLPRLIVGYFVYDKLITDRPSYHVFQNGDQYFGQVDFIMNFSGYGTYYYHNGTIYVGQFEYNKFHGIGVIIRQDFFNNFHGTFGIFSRDNLVFDIFKELKELKQGVKDYFSGNATEPESGSSAAGTKGDHSNNDKDKFSMSKGFGAKYIKTVREFAKIIDKLPRNLSKRITKLLDGIAPVEKKQEKKMQQTGPAEEIMLSFTRDKERKA